MSSDANKILIVEDEPIIAENIYSLLTHSGYNEVFVVHTGADAINTLANNKVSFAILDIHLGGGMTGIDIVEVIHDKYHIPFIFSLHLTMKKP